jgi:hypothetical protein
VETAAIKHGDDACRYPQLQTQLMGRPDFKDKYELCRMIREESAERVGALNNWFWGRKGQLTWVQVGEFEESWRSTNVIKIKEK